MGVETKIFKSGNSLAVRLPKGLGFTVGMPVQIEGDSKGATVRPVIDAAEEKRKLTEWISRLRELESVGEIEVRDPDIFPDRPGLYS